MPEPVRKSKRNNSEFQLFMEAFGQFTEHGKSDICCDRCNGIIEFQRVGDGAWKSHCSCGKYDDTLRGM